MTKSYAPNLETNEETPFSKATNAPNRTEVLLSLWNRSLWLKSKIDNPRTKFDDNLRSRVYFCQVECSILRTILYGLSNEELEFRVRDLEGKLANGVLIPKHE
jgi:hypothetical protein